MGVPLCVLEWAPQGEALLLRALLRHAQRHPAIAYGYPNLPLLLPNPTPEDLAHLLSLSPSAVERVLQVLAHPHRLREIPGEEVRLALLLNHPEVRALLWDGSPLPPGGARATLYLRLSPSLLRWPWTLPLLQGALARALGSHPPAFTVARESGDYWIAPGLNLASWKGTPPASPGHLKALLSPWSPKEPLPPKGFPPRMFSFPLRLLQWG